MPEIPATFINSIPVGMKYILATLCSKPSVQKVRSDWMKTNLKVLSFSERKKARALKNRQPAVMKWVNGS